MSTLAEDLTAFIKRIDTIERERDDAQCETARIAKANSSLCDDLHEANETIASITAERDALAAELADLRKGSAA